MGAGGERIDGAEALTGMDKRAAKKVKKAAKVVTLRGEPFDLALASGLPIEMQREIEVTEDGVTTRPYRFITTIEQAVLIGDDTISF